MNTELIKAQIQYLLFCAKQRELLPEDLKPLIHDLIIHDNARISVLEYLFDYIEELETDTR